MYSEDTTPPQSRQSPYLDFEGRLCVQDDHLKGPTGAGLLRSVVRSMNLEKLPLPRSQTTLLSLRAYGALVEFKNGSAAIDHWKSLAEVLNTLNALACLGRKLTNITPQMLKAVYIALRDAELDEGVVDLDASFMAPLEVLVGSYDACLRTLARRTIAEAMSFIDRCVSEQESMDLSSWCDHFPHPPMLTEPLE